MQGGEFVIRSRGEQTTGWCSDGLKISLEPPNRLGSIPSAPATRLGAYPHRSIPSWRDLSCQAVGISPLVAIVLRVLSLKLVLCRD